MRVNGRLILTTALGCLLTVSAWAATMIPGKVFVAELGGGITYRLAGKSYQLEKGQSLAIQGAHIESAAAAYLVLVYSNGTTIYIDQNTILDVNKFVQEPFPAGVDTTVIEPSVSNTLGRVTKGRVVITTNRLATGTTMLYLTPDAEVRIRGNQVVVEVGEKATTVSVLTGDVTVIPTPAAAGAVGQVLHDGQMAVISHAGAGPAAAGSVQILTLDLSQRNALGPMLAASERAQKIVVFESVTTGEGANASTEIQARAVVPASPPVELTVSPSTLRSGG